MQTADLSAHQVRPLARGAAFPADIFDQIFALDEVEPGDLARIRAEGLALARVMGYDNAAAPPAVEGPVAAYQWKISYTANASFGEVVPNEVLGGNEDEVILRDTCGMFDGPSATPEYQEA
eukprot:3507709-Karenia_brevis.AAC.1